MNLPKKTGVNFVDNLDIVQQFEQMPDGNWVLTDDDMTVELQFVKGIQGLEVQRTTKYSNYNFEDIEPRLFRLKGNVIKEANMLNKSDEYWASEMCIRDRSKCIYRILQFNGEYGRQRAERRYKLRLHLLS